MGNIKQTLRIVLRPNGELWLAESFETEMKGTSTYNGATMAAIARVNVIVVLPSEFRVHKCVKAEPYVTIVGSYVFCTQSQIDLFARFR